MEFERISLITKDTYVFHAALDDRQAAYLSRSIPGTRAGFAGCTTYKHSAFLAERYLKSQDIPYELEIRKKPVPLTGSYVDIHPWVLDTWMKRWQNEGVSEFLHGSGFLQHPPGSGKTCSGIIWAALGPGCTVWITRSISKFKHAKEWERYTTARTHIIFGETPYSLPTADVYIINYEILTNHVDNLCLKNPTSLVFDEIHKVKNASRGTFIPNPHGISLDYVPKKNAAAAAYKLSRKVKRSLGTSATLIKNTTIDLYATLDLINPDEWGTKVEWSARYAGRHIGDYGQIDVSGSSNEKELAERLGHCYHQVKPEEVFANMPPVRRETIKIPETMLSASDRSAASAYAGLGPTERALALAAYRKRPAAVEMIKEVMQAGGKACVITNRKKDVEAFVKALTKELPNVPIRAYHGEMPDLERRNNLETYINLKSSVLVATGSSMGESIDGLQCTDFVAFVQLPNTLAEVEQWEGRFLRLGLDRPVVYAYFIAENSYDEHLASILLSKLPAIETVTNKTNHEDFRRNILGGKTDEQLQDELLKMLLGTVS